MRFSFKVYGDCQPQGSKHSRHVKRGDGSLVRGFGGEPMIVTTEGNKKLAPWRQQVSKTAIAHVHENGGEIIAKPNAVRVAICFYIAKPESVPKKRTFPCVKPDLDKLTRGIFDALTGVLYEDDGQVTDTVVAKRYGSPARAEIEVEIVTSTEFKPDVAKDMPLFAGVMG